MTEMKLIYKIETDSQRIDLCLLRRRGGGEERIGSLRLVDANYHIEDGRASSWFSGKESAY